MSDNIHVVCGLYSFTKLLWTNPNLSSGLRGRRYSYDADEPRIWTGEVVRSERFTMTITAGIDGLPLHANILTLTLLNICMRGNSRSTTTTNKNNNVH